MSEMSPRTTGSLAALDALGATAESLWSRIAPGRSPGALRRILFVGPDAGAGTSTVACSAAAGLARNLRANVMLVEVGAGNSTLAGLLALPEGPGFHDLLCANASLKSCIRGCGLEGLGVVTAGKGVLPPGSLTSDHARKLFEQLGAGQDYLLIDVPPIQAHHELLPLLQHVDEAVLVFEAERTQRDEAKALLEVVTRAGVKVLGSVLNAA